MEKSQHNPWLHRYAALVAFLTFWLIIAGALVTSNDAGLSVPDWPTSFGTFRMPRMVGGVLYEHGHRMIAATVGFLTVLLALWLWKSEPRRWVRRLGGIAVLTVIAQGVLGGITVLFYLPVAISVGHACLAQGFFSITVSLALFTCEDWRWDEPKLEEASAPSIRHLSVATTAAIFLQLMLGAAFRHSGFGIAPHFIGAVVVCACAAWLVTRVLAKHSHEPRLQRPALLVLGLLLAQLLLGFGSYFMRLKAQNAPQPLPPVVAVTTTHVAVGALLLAASVVLMFEAFRILATPGKSIQISSAPERATA